MRKIISCEGKNSFKLILRNDDTCLLRLYGVLFCSMDLNTKIYGLCYKGYVKGSCNSFYQFETEENQLKTEEFRIDRSGWYFDIF